MVLLKGCLQYWHFRLYDKFTAHFLQENKVWKWDPLSSLLQSPPTCSSIWRTRSSRGGSLPCLSAKLNTTPHWCPPPSGWETTTSCPTTTGRRRMFSLLLWCCCWFHWGCVCLHQIRLGIRQPDRCWGDGERRGDVHLHRQHHPGPRVCQR